MEQTITPVKKECGTIIALTAVAAAVTIVADGPKAVSNISNLAGRITGRK